MNRSKAKGSLFAREVCEFLARFVPGVERRCDGGSRDRGDVAGLDHLGWCLELKATPNDLDFAGALREAEREAANAGTRYWAAVIKRRQKGVGDAYVAMPLRIFAAVLAEEAYLRRELERLRDVA